MKEGGTRAHEMGERRRDKKALKCGVALDLLALQHGYLDRPGMGYEIRPRASCSSSILSDSIQLGGRRRVLASTTLHYRVQRRLKALGNR